MARNKRVLHQFTEGLYVGDAVSDHLFMIRRWLREMGFESEIYAELWQSELAQEVIPAAEYRPTTHESMVIHHHAVGSQVADRLLALGVSQLLIYHNITPPQFFAESNPTLARQLARGRQQLIEMQPLTRLALGVSAYNERELKAIGFNNTGILPIVLDESRYNVPLNEKLVDNGRGTPILLFIGRIVPNKKQEDLLKLLLYYRRIEPQARLVLVGAVGDERYAAWLQSLVHELGFEETAVTFTGHISQQEMVTYYKSATAYVSMSEHEGFGKPLIESMYLGLPVLAYAAAAVPDTMGGAGILFRKKNYEALAEIMPMIAAESGMRQRITDSQSLRVQEFLEPNVRKNWQDHLQRTYQKLI